MRKNSFVGNRKETPVRAFGTPYSAPVAKVANPFVGTSRLVSGVACLEAFEAAGINIVSPAKEIAEQGYPSWNRWVLIDGNIQTSFALRNLFTRQRPVNGLELII
jgi:hypothetical protein